MSEQPRQSPGAPSPASHAAMPASVLAALPVLIEALSDAVVLLDRSGAVVAANRRFQDAFAGQQRAVPGMPCPRAGQCLPEQQPEQGCLACEIAHTRSPRRVTQTLTDPNGQRRRWEATLEPVLDDAGRLLLVVEVWRDITDRSQLEAQLAHSERLASLGLLAAGVAHELNNPLASVLAGIESLQRLTQRAPLDDETRAEADEVLGWMIEASTRCRETTEKLLLLAQPHSGRPVWVDLNRAASDTLALLGYATRKQGVRVQTELTDGLPLVWGREGALRGTLMNLCLNAVQAMPGGGQLWVRTRLENDHVVVEVEDDGPGIPPEHVHRIWDPFFTTKPVGQGTGLGLSITQRIVADHGGRIRVTSPPGRGACFTVTLPLREDGGSIG